MTPQPTDRGFVPLPDGGRIAFQLHGREHRHTPLLLIRPLGGSMALWGEFRDVLSGRVCVISFDYRGTGHSSHDPRWVTTKGLARDSLSVLDHLAVESAHVFGISLGGMTATWLAILAPDRVQKLTVAAAPARGLALTHAGVRRELGLAACFARAAEDVEVALVDRILSHHFRDTHPADVRRIEALVRAEPGSRAALLKHALAGGLHDASRDLHRIHSKTLVLAGDRDTLLGTDAPRALSGALPDSTFETISDSGHDLTLEQPIATATRVGEFLRA